MFSLIVIYPHTNLIINIYIIFAISFQLHQRRYHNYLNPQIYNNFTKLIRQFTSDKTDIHHEYQFRVHLSITFTTIEPEAFPFIRTYIY